ncbi:MAG: hypothetical protein HUJ74_03675 [Lachnospiraceae bacterium]|nr:hypothetical protein [Lachnospiraceae bacterium]
MLHFSHFIRRHMRILYILRILFKYRGKILLHASKSIDKKNGANHNNEGRNKIKNAAISTAIKTALNYLEKSPEKNVPKIMELVDQLYPENCYISQRNAIRQTIENKNNWYNPILRIYSLDTKVRKTFFTNFITNASLKESALQKEIAKNNCNIPWAILLDPTSLHVIFMYWMLGY